MNLAGNPTNPFLYPIISGKQECVHMLSHPYANTYHQKYSDTFTA